VRSPRRWISGSRALPVHGIQANASPAGARLAGLGRRSAALGTLFAPARRPSEFRANDRGCRRHPVGFRTFRTHLPTPTNRAAGLTTGDPPP
jgi:hypothetical protein